MNTIARLVGLGDLTKPERDAIAARLREARRLKRLTLATVAEHMGLHETSVSRLERGQVAIEEWHISRLASLYEVDPQWLIEGSVEGSPQPQSRSASGQVAPPRRYLICPVCGREGVPEDGLRAHMASSECPSEHSEAEIQRLVQQALVDTRPWAFVMARYEREIAAVRKAMRFRVKGRAHLQSILSSLEASLDQHLQIGPDRFLIRTPALDDPYHPQDETAVQRLIWADDIMRSIEIQEELDRLED